jgi:hypothetical protein
MNEDDFKRHLKDLVHGHHHPEEHDWQDQTAPTPPAKAGPKKVGTQRRRAVSKKASKK